MSRIRTLAAGLAGALTLSSLGLAVLGGPAGADGVSVVPVTCSGIPIVGSISANVNVEASDSADPVVVGGAVSNSIHVPIPVGDVPIDVTITEVKLNVPKPTGVTVTNVTFVGASSLTTKSWSQTASTVTATLSGSVTIGPGKPVPSVPDVVVATTVAGPPRTVQWKVPSSIVAKGTAGILGSITASCTPGDPNQVLVSTTVQAPPNQAPTATDQTVATPFQTAKSITLSGTDPEAGPLSFAVTSDPPHGTVTGTAPNVTYTPDPGFSGQDSFTFTATDNGSLADTGTITVNVGAAVPVLPGAPTIDGTPAIAQGQATVAWSAPATDGGAEITAYRIYPTTGGVAGAVVQVAGDQRSATIQVGDGQASTFTVAAVNSVGEGPKSAASTPVTPRVWLPFASNTEAVTRLHQWLLGRAPTAAELALWVGRFQAGTHTPPDLVAALRSSTDNTGSVDPVVRLYAAYFLRVPDKPGTVYWIGKKRTGTSLTKISDGFANSVEFKTRYGTLSNRDFVELIYQNILGRPGEESGIAFWTSELNSGHRSRGAVMIGFSNSLEYRTKQDSNVNSAVGWILMADKTPTTAERDAFATTYGAASPKTAAWRSFLRTPAVVTRATA